MEKVYINDIIRIDNNQITKNTYHEDIQIYLDLNTGVEYLFAKHFNTDQLFSYGAGGMTVRYKANGDIWVLSTNEMKEVCKRYIKSIGEPEKEYHFFMKDDKEENGEEKYLDFIIINH